MTKKKTSGDAVRIPDEKFERLSIMDQENATLLVCYLAHAVDQALRQSREAGDMSTDGQVAVVAVFQQLDRLGYVLATSFVTPARGKGKS